jgi:hypothetical protein
MKTLKQLRAEIDALKREWLRDVAREGETLTVSARRVGTTYNVLRGEAKKYSVPFIGTQTSSSRLRSRSFKEKRITVEHKKGLTDRQIALKLKLKLRYVRQLRLEAGLSPNKPKREKEILKPPLKAPLPSTKVLTPLERMQMMAIEENKALKRRSNS